MVKASIKLGHPTYVFSRPDSNHTEMLNELQSMGATIVKGRLDEHDKLVSLLSEVDVVISALSFSQVFDQLKIIEAIKVAGNIKRFLPSDFGVEEDRVSVLPPFRAFLEKKKKIRQRFLPSDFGVEEDRVSVLPPFRAFLEKKKKIRQKEEITVYGSAEAKAVFNYEEDMGFFSIKLATDPRTCNRVLTYRPTANVISQLELISMWEKKIGKTFNKVHVPDEELVDLSESLPRPQNIPVSILHGIFEKGVATNFDLCEELEASALYPELKLTTIDELLDIFLHKPPKPASTAFE